MGTRRLIVGCLAAAVLAGSGIYLIGQQLRSCSLLDIWLRHSGCIAAHGFSDLFDGKSLNNPAMAFEGDSDRLALAMTETQPATAASAIPQRYTLLEVSAESGVVLRRTPLGGFEEGRLNGAILLSWNGRHAVMVLPQPGSAATPTGTEQVAAALRLMPLIGSDPGWEKPMGDIPASRSGFGQFDPDNERFRLFTGAWTIGGEKIDRGQVNWNRAFGSSDMPVNMPDGTTAVVRASRGVIEIVQADGRRSSHDLGIDRQQISTNWLLLSPDGRRLSLILRPVEADGILQVWDIGTGQRLINAAVPGLATEAAWSKDGRRLAVRRDGREGSGYALFAIGD